MLSKGEGERTALNCTAGIWEGLEFARWQHKKQAWEKMCAMSISRLRTWLISHTKSYSKRPCHEFMMANARSLCVCVWHIRTFECWVFETSLADRHALRVIMSRWLCVQPGVQKGVWAADGVESHCMLVGVEAVCSFLGTFCILQLPDSLISPLEIIFPFTAQRFSRHVTKGFCDSPPPSIISELWTPQLRGINNL